ncbi:prevent-host-death protein [Nocardia sp. NPDC060249]|uniref:prevent-host-death protein n=1 Tax=Nocardia sp. NPDC060249 TaxID=3347082 RepID=UPI003666CDC0
MQPPPEITEAIRDRSEEILAAVELRQPFTVIWGGERIRELIPLHRRGYFVSRVEFAVTSRTASIFSVDSFRADQVV